VRVTVPDLICVLDSVSGEAIGTETVRYGQRVTVVGLPAPAILRTPKGLQHVGPRAFGYDLEFRSLFPAADGGAACAPPPLEGLGREADQGWGEGCEHRRTPPPNLGPLRGPSPQGEGENPIPIPDNAT